MSAPSFRLASYCGTYHTAHLPDGSKVIVGILLPKVWTFHFSVRGVLKSKESMPIEFEIPMNEGIYMTGSVSHKLDELLDSRLKSLRALEEPILIQEFFDPETHTEHFSIHR